MNAGPKELNEDFIRSLPDNGPVVMVNLLRFKGELADGDGSGWDAYSRYSKAIPPLLKGVGGTILWAGDVEGAAYGDLNAKHWEFVVLVRSLQSNEPASAVSMRDRSSNTRKSRTEAKRQPKT